MQWRSMYCWPLPIKMKTSTSMQHYILRSSPSPSCFRMDNPSSVYIPHFLFPIIPTSPRISVDPSLVLDLGRWNSLIVLHTPLPLLVLRHLAQAHVASTLGIHLGELDSRTEILRLPRFADDAVEFVDLLETETFGLVDHEPTGKGSVSVRQRRWLGLGGTVLRDSGTYTKAMQTKQNEPHTKKTLDWRFAWSSSTM